MKKVIYLRALTKEDFCNPRIVSFLREHDDFSPQEYHDFINSITIETDNAKKIIDFIAHYQNGCLCPQKYNGYEPINKIFNPEDISEPVRGLSHPAGAFFLNENYHLLNAMELLKIKDLLLCGKG
ncbi:MAG: hypothetical protein RR346_01350 [Bacteroidales bacterium]